MYVTIKGDQAIPRSWLVDDCTTIQCPTDVDEDDVEKALREYEEDILKIMEGTDENMAEEIIDAIRDALEELPRYREVDVWFSDTTSDLETEVEAAVKSGADREATIKAITKRLCDEAKRDDILIAEHEVEDWLENAWDKAAIKQKED